MSAFLGPIHHWLFNKIKFQNNLVEDIIILSEEKRYALKRKDLDSVCGILEEGNLEDLIDEMNIHGWLQERLAIVEKRLAYSLTVLINENNALEDIKDIAYQAGIKVKAGTDTKAGEIYGILENVLVNGMPCDRVNVVTTRTDSIVEWNQAEEIHAKYYEEFSGDVKNYYIIREQIIRGIVSDTDFEFINDTDKFIIRKRA